VVLDEMPKRCWQQRHIQHLLDLKQEIPVMVGGEVLLKTNVGSDSGEPSLHKALLLSSVDATQAT